MDDLNAYIEMLESDIAREPNLTAVAEAEAPTSIQRYRVSDERLYQDSVSTRPSVHERQDKALRERERAEDEEEARRARRKSLTPIKSPEKNPTQNPPRSPGKSPRKALYL